MRRALLALLAAAAASPAFAQDPSAEMPGVELRLDRTSLELRVSAQRLTAGYPAWREASLLLARPWGAHRVQGELSSLERFDSRGTYLAVMDTYTVNPDWYATLAAGAGDGAFFLPRSRFDAILHRKLLADRSLVAFAGVSDYRSPDGHRDRALALGAIRYFTAPWVVQAAVRFNESRPGGIRTRQQYVAVTHGREPGDQVVARYGWGREGYLAIGPATTLVDFASREGSLQWRHRFARDLGFSLGLEHYRNPYYTRSGASLAVFMDMP